MIKLKQILLEQTAKEAYDEYVPLRNEEVALMKDLLGDEGLYLKIQRKTGKIKSTADMDFLEFPKDLKAPEFKKAFEKKVGRVKEIRDESKKLEDIMRKEFGDQYLDKELKPFFAKQLEPIIEEYTNATTEVLKLMQKRSIELKKSNMADERDKYRAELRKWYEGGQKGEKPEMPITPAQKKMLQQFGDMEIPKIGSTKLKMAAPITKGSVFK